MANAAPQLQEAYDLIESGDLQSARQLLENIRPENENNPDFWWIYAHAVQNETDGMAAIDRVRQLAPNYPGLQNLSEKLGISSLQRMQSLSPRVPAPSTEDVEDYYDDDADEADEFDTALKSRDEGSKLLPFLIIGGIAVVVVVGLLLVAMNLFSGGDGNATATPVADIVDVSPEPILPTFGAESITEEATEAPSLTPMDEATVASSVTPTTEEEVTEQATDTDEPPTEAATDTDVPPTDTPTQTPSDTPVPENTDPFADVYTEIAAFGVPEDGIVVDTTNSFGDTYVITTCSALGPVATQNIIGIMDSLASIADTLDEEVSGMAFAITDCNTDTVSIRLGFDRETADSYWSGEIDQSGLQRAIARVS